MNGSIIIDHQDPVVFGGIDAHRLFLELDRELKSENCCPKHRMFPHFLRAQRAAALAEVTSSPLRPCFVGREQIISSLCRRFGPEGPSILVKTVADGCIL